MKEVTRVVIVQGHCLLRSALIERLEREPWIEVCAVSSDVAEAQELILKHRPHVAVINISPKCSAGMTSLKKLKREFIGLAVLAFACDSEFEDLYAGLALRSEANGYVSSADTPGELVRAIRTVRGGKRYISPRIRSNRNGHTAAHEVLAGLSRREAEVFCLTGCGHVPKSIAEMMNLSVKTIESYRERIRAKMDLDNGADLLYSSVSFMRNATRRGIDASDYEAIRALLSTTA
ncbi:MAG: response regulator transcription factor [Kiritimatiellales bacterium]